MKTIPRKLGRYAIIREVGRGAMGVVYKAHDPVIEREVAIKAIQLAFEVDTEEKDLYLGRFYREAKAAGKLNHPNIVTIYDVDEDKESNTPFIVMEFLEGTTLQEIMSSGILLPIEDVTSIISQIADALNYAHEQGVVHRDVKSANILILQGMKPKIMDFGIARLVTSDLTRSGQFIGTPNYMSPEQIDGKAQVDGRSDLFSLGVIFYMLLTGERPFAGESFTTVSYKIVHVDPIPPRIINPAVPDGYNMILARLLAKNPDDRYATGADLISDLRKIESGEFNTLVPPEVGVAGEATVASSGSEQSSDLASTSAGSTKVSAPDTSPRHATKSRRWLAVVAAPLLIAALAIGGVYLYNSAQAKQNPEPEGVADIQLKDLSRQNAVRIKWDLAVNYNQTGMYDKSIEELTEILRLEPSNEEARQYMALVRERKALSEKEQELAAEVKNQKKALEEVARLQRQSQQSQQQPAQTPQPSPLAAPPVQDMAAPLPVNRTKVHFELEHSFPSGSFYVYQDNQLVYESFLTGEEKKVLMFSNYKGKLSGSFEVPVGKVSIILHIISKELGVSARKTITVEATAERPHLLRLKYMKTSKQLDAKWM